MLPKGLTADISASVVYANFSVGDTSVVDGGNATDISYFVVLNITDNSDDWAKIHMVNFDAAQTIAKGISSDSPFFSKNWTSNRGWTAKGAWVDGEWYNLTWVPFPSFYAVNTTWWNKNPPDADWFEDYMDEGYWMEGVQIRDKYVGGTLTNTYINMNGTWVDVTGRIDVDRPDGMDPSKAVTASGTFFGEMKTFGPGGSITHGEDIGLSITTSAGIQFNNLWAPHQSRLIALSADRQVLSRLLEPSKLEQLKTEPITFRGSVHHQVNGSIGIYDSWAVDDEIKQVQLEITEDGYLYNVILSDDQMFVMDSFGVEVFVEPRN